LKVENIDYDRGLIYVKSAKGKKDRYTTLSNAVIEELNHYKKIYRPEKWLFPGMDRDRHLTVRSAEKILEKAREKAGIAKNATIHTLRHSFATH
jgi:integrase